MTRFVMTSALCAALALSASEAFVTKSAFIPSVHSVAPPTISTSLQMNLFDRFSRVAKSNLNNILQNLEDPEKIMGQALEDMQVSPDLITVTSIPFTEISTRIDSLVFSLLGS